MKYPEVVLTRFEKGENGVFSRVVAPAGFECYGLEKPDRGNQPNISCVPKGIYLFKYGPSVKRGLCYEEYDDPNTAEHEDVPGRDHIQIHKANWEDELLGCISLGRAIMDIKRPDGTMKKGVTSSKDAVHFFELHMEKKTFRLTIKEEYK